MKYSKKKRNLVVVISVIVLAVVIVFIPKNVGGVLCGPVCPSYGLHYYEQDCLGIKSRYNVIDAYYDNCYGLAIGERMCYGVPYSEENLNDRELDCNYPCTDDNLRIMCQDKENITIGPYTYSCEWFIDKCNWK